jgi:transposase InsO family protein
VGRGTGIATRNTSRPCGQTVAFGKRDQRARFADAGRIDIERLVEDRPAAEIGEVEPAVVQAVIHRRGPWRSYEAVEFATLTWVDWFNKRRLLEPIGNIPPAEAEERYYAMREDPALAA